MTVDTLARDFATHIAALQRGTEAALAATGFDAVILCSGSAASKNRFDDQYHPLSPTPAFSHWCPLVEADSYVVVRPGRAPTLVRTHSDDFWEAPAPVESDHFWSAFELAEVRPGHISDALPGGRTAVVTRDPGSAPPGAVNPSELIAQLDALRTVKSDYEIACLAHASRRAAVGHRRLAERFAAGPVSELELHLEYLMATEQDDTAAPYKNIVALGAHAAVLHYVSYQRVRVHGDTSLLVDAGGKHQGYGSDITRTHVRGTSPSARRFGDLIAAVDRAQQAVIAMIKPGLPYEDLHDASHRVLASELRGLGIVRGSDDELVDRGVTRALFPHGLGHSLGICVHDVGMKLRPPRANNPFLRNTSVIAAGQVFTIEPGIYVIDALLAPLRHDDRAPLIDWAAIDDLRPYGGVRIEDNVVVQAAGTRNLTREALVATT